MPLSFDLESDGLLQKLTKIHCICIKDEVSGEMFRFDPISRPIEDGIKMLQEADELIGHNIARFDIPAIQKLYPSFEPQGIITDTLIMARLVFPGIKGTDYGRFRKGLLPGKLIGSHSLEAYGYRLGEFKGEFAKETDWSTWTEEMSDYCEQDVVVTSKLYRKLMTYSLGKEALNLEHEVAKILNRQEKRGVWFDVEAAEKLYAEINERKMELEEKLQETFPPIYKKGKSFVPKRDNKRYGYVEGCEMTKVELQEFNPGSQQQIYQRLMSPPFNWEPTEFTEKSNEPKVDDEILRRLPWPEAQQLADYLMLKKRLGQIGDGKQAWLKCVTDEGKIHGEVNTMGTVTGRMSHSKPNLGQIPNAHSEYGPECRALFHVKTGWKLVGCDAAGLEARCLAHYMAKFDGGAYTKIILEGKKADKTDVHNLNASALVRWACTRNNAKTWFYAFMYGGGDGKLGAILGGGFKDGKLSRAAIGKKFPALKKLTDKVKEKVKAKGFLIGLDGRKLHSRSAHSALNLLLQSAGAIVMKKALVICDEDIQEAGLLPGRDYEFVLNVHDEFQIEVRDINNWPELVGQIAEQSITKAGEYFDFRCRLDGEYMIGTNWKETH